jgi:hypothetical protein
MIEKTHIYIILTDKKEHLAYNIYNYYPPNYGSIMPSNKIEVTSTARSHKLVK